MYLTDQHCHTVFSFDGHAELADVCEAALAQGLRAIAITDHMDVDCEDCGLHQNYKSQERRNLILDMKKKYKGKMDVIYGIELGQPYNYPEFSEGVVKEDEYEFVLGSVHNLKGVPDFCFLKYEKMEQSMIDKLFERSLDDTYRLAQLPYVHSIAHLTYLMRYISLAGMTLNPKQFSARIARVYSQMIKTDKALEINTSTLRKGMDFTMPNLDLLRLYRECGGKYITVGSDAHYAKDVGADIEAAYDLMKKCGYESVTVFSGSGRAEFKIV